MVLRSAARTEVRFRRRQLLRERRHGKNLAWTDGFGGSAIGRRRAARIRLGAGSFGSGEALPPASPYHEGRTAANGEHQ